MLGFAFKAILIKLAFAGTSIDAVTLLTLRMVYAVPFFALMAWWSTRTSWLLDEPVHWIQLAGAALVLAGVALVTLRPARN